MLRRREGRAVVVFVIRASNTRRRRRRRCNSTVIVSSTLVVFIAVASTRRSQSEELAAGPRFGQIGVDDVPITEYVPLDSMCDPARLAALFDEFDADNAARMRDENEPDGDDDDAERKASKRKTKHVNFSESVDVREAASPAKKRREDGSAGAGVADRPLFMRAKTV